MHAHRLMEAGVTTELQVFPDVPHGFDLRAPDAEVSRRARTRRSQTQSDERSTWTTAPDLPYRRAGRKIRACS